MWQGCVRRGGGLNAWSLMIVAALIMSGCATKPVLEKTGEFIDDSSITTKVKSTFLAEPMVSVFAISVSTSDGVVRLEGFVNSQTQRQRAIQLAQGVAGVKRVDSRNLYVRQ